MPKRTPDEVLRALEQSDIDDEMERVLAMSRDERRRELDAAGVDLRKLDARVAALRESAGFTPAPVPPGAPEPKTVAARFERPRRAPPRWVALLAAALAFGAFAFGAVHLGLPVADRLWRQSHPPPASSSAPSPQRLRDAALDACAARRWQACLDGLQRARELDPRGDADDRVQAAWRTATDALRAASPAPSDPERKR